MCFRRQPAADALNSILSASVDPVLLGQSFENFVVMELRKQSTWSQRSVRLHHFRDLKNHEVDIVLEDRAGDVVGIEVKAGATVTVSDFNGLRKLKDLTGARFKRGVVLHTGKNAVPFSDGLWALPIHDAVFLFCF